MSPLYISQTCTCYKSKFFNQGWLSIFFVSALINEKLGLGYKGNWEPT